MNRLSQRYTFFVIPDANQTVRKYTISKLIIILLPILMLSALIGAAISFFLFARSTETIESLEGQLTSSKAHYEQLIADQELELADMQVELVTLLDQANTTENKLAEITELERQLKELIGMDSTKSNATISSFLATEGGQGGEEYPLSDEPETLVNTTSQQYTEISERLDVILPQLEETKAAVIKYKEILRITPTIWPTDSRRVTSLFGTRKDPFTRKATFHSGLDIGGNSGDPIYAAADGTVVRSERDRIYGHYITINHGRGLQTRYLHLRKRSVDVGDKVVKGQAIGELGNTGRSTGPHLHYEVLLHGTAINPEPYIKADREGF